MVDEPKYPEVKDGFYSYRSLAWIVSILVTPIISIVTSYYTAVSASQKANIEIVNLAVKIIQEPGGNRELAEWAIGALQKYSEVPLSEESKIKMLDATINNGGLELSKPATHIDMSDVLKNGVVGGENSLFRKPFGIDFQ